MKHLLITGGAGFIGSNFVRHLLAHEPDARITTLDALTYAGRRENLENLPDPSRHRFVQGDIGNRALVEKLLREHQIDTVVHFAAESHVDRSIHDPGAFVQTNIVGTFTLLEACRAVWLGKEGGGQLTVDSRQLTVSTASTARPSLPVNRQPSTGNRQLPFRFHHVSTDEVFGSLGPQDAAFTETTPYDPSSPYSASKAGSDHLVRAYARTYGLPVTITNCSNNYGPYQFPEKLIPLMILNALEGNPLPVYGDGRQVRDWLFVEDHCDAIRQVLLRGRPGETYNVGGNNQPTNLEIVQQICALVADLPPHPSSLITFVKDRPGHDRRYAMDITKIQRELGWQPRESLATGLRKTVQWYLDHPQWIAAIRGQGGYREWVEKNYAQRSEACPPGRGSSQRSAVGSRQSEGSSQRSAVGSRPVAPNGRSTKKKGKSR